MSTEPGNPGTENISEQPKSPRKSPRTPATRRQILGAGLATGAALGAGGWRAAASSKHPLRKPGSRPYPKLPAGTDTIPQIEHIVILMMENHSYDNKFGVLRRRGADGFKLGPKGHPIATNPYPNGDIQHAFRMPTLCQLDGHPAQDWLASHTQYASGRNSGFVKSGSGPVSMGYWGAEDQPFYYSMARTFPIADRYFCSLLGQTDPNRRFLISATSLGQVNDFTPKESDYPAGGTIFDHLDTAGITWRDYFSSLPTTLLYPKLYLNNSKKVLPIKHFFTDAAAGKLPGVCLVEPDYDVTSEENPQNIAQGEQFAANVINAVMSGPGWDKTLLVWNYDEHGGYYDHVPPPKAIKPDSIKPKVPKGELVYDGFGRYGFRVPCAVISPWAKPDYVSHRVMDHASVCALIEAKWNLPAMTFRDANAENMLDMLDLKHPAFLKPPKLAKPLVDTDHKALSCNKSGPGKIPPPGSVSKPHPK